MQQQQQQQQWVSIIESRGRRRGNGPEQNGPAVCLSLCLSLGLWRSDKEPEGEVILKLWLCQQATNPQTKLSWPEAVCLQYSQLTHTNPYAHVVPCTQTCGKPSCIGILALSSTNCSTVWKEHNTICTAALSPEIYQELLYSKNDAILASAISYICWEQLWTLVC